jgi:hypothetical protein
MEVNDEYFDQSSIFTLGLKAGVGLSYIVADHFQFLAGIDYIYRKWQDVEVISYYQSATISQTDSGTKMYIGFNFWFGGASDSSYKAEEQNSEKKDDLIY